MITLDEFIEWAKSNWVIKTPIDTKPLFDSDGWECEIDGNESGDMWLHVYPDKGTMWLRAVSKGRKAMLHLTSEPGKDHIEAREPFSKDVIAKAMDALFPRRRVKEDPRFVQTKLF